MARFSLRQEEIHCSPPQFLVKRLFSAFGFWCFPFIICTVTWMHYSTYITFITGWTYFSIVKRGYFSLSLFKSCMINFVDSTSSSAIRSFPPKLHNVGTRRLLSYIFLDRQSRSLFHLCLLLPPSCYELVVADVSSTPVFVLCFGVATRK